MWLLVIRCSHIGAFFGFGHMPVYRISVSIRQFSTGLRLRYFMNGFEPIKILRLFEKFVGKSTIFYIFRLKPEELAYKTFLVELETML